MFEAFKLAVFMLGLFVVAILGAVIERFTPRCLPAFMIVILVLSVLFLFLPRLRRRVSAETSEDSEGIDGERR
jgi:uncharacterized membrane protein YfcA